ncbi:MAG: hypothetical protein EPO32_01940 [Anaerolineae bacterium]|nr:MAG: hypothetical protein EPO32_01940 [Anaerolineae bacterium]
MGKLPRTFLLILLTLALAACSTPILGIGQTDSLEGTWRRTEMVVRRTAGPDQPVVEPPFTVIGTLLIIDEEDLILVEQVGNEYRLAGAAENWTCALTGAYSIPIELVYTEEAAGEIRWRAEDLDLLAETMAEPWGNTCVYSPGDQGIPTSLEDQAPLVSSPSLSLAFQILDDGKTLALSTRFTVEEGEGGALITIERAYLYTRER